MHEGGINYVNELRDDGANVRVINQTYVGPPGGYFQDIKDAITAAAYRDILFVAAAGNHGAGAHETDPPWNNDITRDLPLVLRQRQHHLGGRDRRRR